MTLFTTRQMGLEFIILSLFKSDKTQLIWRDDLERNMSENLILIERVSILSTM